MSDVEIPGRDRKFLIVICGIVTASVIVAGGLIWWRHPKDIFDAAWRGDAKAVERFLARGVGPNSLNDVKDIPLHLAKTRDVAELLLARGSNLDQPNGFGGTPLHMAAVNARPEVAAFLIERGANVNALDIIGATPLDHALIGRRDKIGRDRDAVIRLFQSKGGVARHYADLLK
jgi:26S proteasome non-ATPase regulatory subunit 10